MSALTIERLGHKGDGMAAGGILAPLTLPGEVIEGEVVEGRIEAPRILTPSPHRVRPGCPHFRSCGGCSLQHGADDFVAEWKQEVVKTALSAQGLRAPFRPIETSPPYSRRRATLAGRRTKKGALVGFHARRSDTIVALSSCHILHPDLMALLPTLEEITRLGASRSSTLAFGLTRSLNGVELVVTGAKPLDEALRLSLPKFTGTFARLVWGDEVVFTMAAPEQDFGGTRVTPPPGAFLQATEAGEAALLAGVEEATEGARHVVDLFSGCGTFSLPLARRATVHAVEGLPEMTDALAHAVRFAQGLKQVTTETRDLFRRPLLPDELARFDAAVIDPPRAGAEAQTRALAEAGVPKIGFVSCNPVSFARDARLLVEAGYALDWVQVVDQFRWSAHVELVAAFSCSAG